MKKVLSLLVAVVFACTFSVATFAADDIPGELTRTRSLEPYVNVVGTSNEISVGAGELYMVDNSSKIVGGVYNKLDPDTEYNFRIYWNNTGATLQGTNADVINGGVELNGKMLEDGTIRLRTLKGSSYISTAKVKTIGRGDSARYEVQLTTRAYYGTKMNDVEYTLNVTGSTATANTFVESTHYFEVGYEEISDSETDVGEDGVIIISNDYPVILKEQFSDIAKSANYKNVTFEGEDGGWIYTGRVSGMGDSNFYFTYDVVPELMNKFPEQEFKFLSFKAGVTFPSNGEMRIDASDIYDTFDSSIYTYMYRNGKLVRVNHTYDAVNEEVVFRTNYLGTFVITDREITDTTIVDDNSNVEEPGDEIPEPENPSTGASSAVSLGVTLGLASLITAGAVSRKRK